jgi:hypothetical protein
MKGSHFFGYQDQREMTVDIWIRDYNTPRCDLLHQDQTADVSIIRAKTGTFSMGTLDVHLAP